MRILRNRIFTFLVLFLLSVLLIVGCGQGSGQQQVEVQAPPSVATEVQAVPTKASKSDVFVFLMNHLPENIDPHVRDDSPSWTVFEGLYDTLVDYKPGAMELEPELATAWEMSSDSTVFTFHLRQGVKFHDGTEFDATAVKANYERMRELNVGNAFMFTMVNRVEVPDPFTVKFVLDVPFAAFTENLAWLPIASPVAIKEHANDGEKGIAWWAENGVGTGPYTVEKFARGEEIILRRFEQYWRGWKGGHVTTFVLRQVPESATQRAMLERGEAHLGSNFSFDDLEDMKANSNLMVYSFPSIRQYYHVYNTRKDPLTNQKVRQALALAFDYETYVKDVLQGYALQPKGLLPEVMRQHDDSLPLQEGNLDKAKQLLAEAGYPGGGFELEFMYLESYEWQRLTAELTRDQLAKIGITLKLVGQPWATIVERMKDPARRPDIASVLVYPTTSSADTLLWPMYHTDSGHFANFGFSDSEIDRLLEEARQTSDSAKRDEIYIKLQRLLAEKVPTVARATFTVNWVTASNVKGLVLQQMRPLVPPLYSIHIQE